MNIPKKESWRQMKENMALKFSSPQPSHCDCVSTHVEKEKIRKNPLLQDVFCNSKEKHRKTQFISLAFSYLSSAYVVGPLNIYAHTYVRLCILQGRWTCSGLFLHIINHTYRTCNFFLLFSHTTKKKTEHNAISNTANCGHTLERIAISSAASK